MLTGIPLGHICLGTCGICGGPVTAPQTWLGIIPPTPQCNSCGALAAQDYGPALPMVQPKTEVRWTIATGANA